VDICFLIRPPGSGLSHIHNNRDAIEQLTTMDHYPVLYLNSFWIAASCNVLVIFLLNKTFLFLFAFLQQQDSSVSQKLVDAKTNALISFTKISGCKN